MGRHPTSNRFITPFVTTGTEQPETGAEFGRGSFTLLANTTYFFPLGGQDCPFLSAHIQWDASIALTAVKLEDCDFPDGPDADHGEVPYWSDNAGEWIDEDPTTAFVGTVSTGTTVTNGVVAHTAGAQGGAMFHYADNGAERVRLRVEVGATGGEVRVGSWGKE